MAESNNQPEQGNNPPYRPLKFSTPQELDMAIQLYFDKCDPHIEKHKVATGVRPNGETMFEDRDIITEQKPYTMAGLARALNIDRKTLLNYKNRDDFFPSIMAAKQRCEEYAEGQLFGPYANGAKFSLVNNFQDEFRPWADRQVMAGDPDAPLSNPMTDVTTELLRKLAEEQPDGDNRPDQA